MKKLVIVESPTKSKTIKGFLGKDFIVLSSYGHVMDLPKSTLGVDIEHNFEPTLEQTNVRAKKALTEIRKALVESDEVILATDEDREGEAIAFHLAQVLKLNNIGKAGEGIKKARAGKTSHIKSVKRIVFHEITKSAIQEALANPRQIDQHRVDAQTARRVLDRLVGYKLSPLLWKKIFYGLSAGRVQSVAVRLIVEREEEREAFKPEEFWLIGGLFAKPDDISQSSKHFEAQLYAANGTKLDKLAVTTQSHALEIKNALEKATFSISNIEDTEATRNPGPPFTTATLQAEASNRLGMSPKRTMSLAQSLYEGVKIRNKHTGLITYHRTDSTLLAGKAIAEIASYIKKEFGEQYHQVRQFHKKQKGAQEAHEAIRPTDVTLTPDIAQAYLEPSQLKLYRIIWQRTMASQMAQARFRALKVDITTHDNAYTLRAEGLKQLFDGFLRIYPNGTKEVLLPVLAQGDPVVLIDHIINAAQNFTKPPARYTEASLIKALKDHGIGRPSTYAPTIETIKSRRYVEMDENRRLEPTELGRAVNKLLVKHFTDIVDIEFTANMEQELDDIAEGTKEWVPVIRTFYEPFAKKLAVKDKEIDKKEVTETATDKICPECGAPVVRKLARHGSFFSCSRFPKCKYGQSIIVSTGVTCPKCKTNQLIERRTGKGKLFYGCAGYPTCKNGYWDKPSGEMCPDCGLMLVIKGKRLVCSDRKCGFKREK